MNRISGDAIHNAKDSNERSEGHTAISVTVRITEDDPDYIIPQKTLWGSHSVLGTRKTQDDITRIYKNNDGSFCAAVVCDGIGGLGNGRRASERAASLFMDAAREIHLASDYTDFLRSTIKEIDFDIASMTDESGKRLHAGTTLSAVIIENRNLYWISVGDSVIYHLRQGAITRLTNAHTYAFHAKQTGTAQFNPVDALPDALISFIGIRGVPYIDMNPQPFLLQEGDMLVLSSDGLYKHISEHLIHDISSTNRFNLNFAAKKLIDTAASKAAGETDNITVALMLYDG